MNARSTRRRDTRAGMAYLVQATGGGGRGMKSKRKAEGTYQAPRTSEAATHTPSASWLQHCSLEAFEETASRMLNGEMPEYKEPNPAKSRLNTNNRRTGR